MIERSGNGCRLAPVGVIHQRDYRDCVAAFTRKRSWASIARGIGACLGRPRLQVGAGVFSVSGERSCVSSPAAGDSPFAPSSRRPISYEAGVVGEPGAVGLNVGVDIPAGFSSVGRSLIRAKRFERWAGHDPMRDCPEAVDLEGELVARFEPGYWWLPCSIDSSRMQPVPTVPEPMMSPGMTLVPRLA